MAKPRKMLGDVFSPECAALRDLIQTQSKKTLGAWACQYAQERYLPVYEELCPEDGRFRVILAACGEYLAGARKLADLKPLLREGPQIARDCTADPVAQAAARAVSTACAAVQTPTSALGFLFYGAAAVAYREKGLEETSEVYDELALTEFRRALVSLQAVAVADEPDPVKISWNC